MEAINRKEYLMTDEELYQVTGGTSISASMLNAISRGVETIYNLGRAFGTAINMIIKGRRCN